MISVCFKFYYHNTSIIYFPRLLPFPFPPSLFHFPLHSLHLQVILLQIHHLQTFLEQLRQMIKNDIKKVLSSFGSSLISSTSSGASSLESSIACLRSSSSSKSSSSDPSFSPPGVSSSIFYSSGFSSVSIFELSYSPSLFSELFFFSSAFFLSSTCFCSSREIRIAIANSGSMLGSTPP